MSRKTRKLIWSAPLVAVIAVVGALALFMTLAPNAALAHDPPGPVTSLAATADGYDTIKLSWGAPSTGGASTGYRIDVSKDTLEWDSLVANTGNTRTTYTHEGLKPESERFYRVFALNAAGAGPSPVVQDQLFAAATTGEAQAPSVVLNVRAAATGSSKVVLTWAAPADNGGAEIDRYCIIADGDGDVVDANPDNDWPLVADTNPMVCAAATFDVETGIGSVAGGLIAVSGKKTTFEHKAEVSTAQTWRYRVYAVNSANETEQDSAKVRYSNIARARTAGQSDLGKPTDLRIATDSTTYANILLYWNWPRVDNKADTTLTAFEYQSRTRDTSTGAWTGYAPEPPESVPVPGTGDNLYQASESRPLPFVDKGNQVQFRVRSVKGMGVARETSGWTVSSTLTHQGPHDISNVVVADRTPVVLTETPTDLKADDEKFLNRIDLSWKKASTARASYIDMSLDPADTDDGARNWIRLEGNTTYARETFNHIRLEPGQTIQYRIIPWHSRGFGMAATTSGSTKTAFEPQAVRGLSVAADGQNKLTVSWTRTPASDNGGSAVVGYLVQVANDIDNNPTLDLTAPISTNDAGWLNVDTTIVSGATVTDGANGGSYTYTSDDDELAIITSEGLPAGSTRWFRVFAINGVNKSAPSVNDLESAVWEDGTTAGPSVPGAPRYLVAETARDSSGTDLTERGVVLLWTEPVSSAGDTIRGYIIERSVDGGAWTELQSTVDGTDSFYTDYTDTEEPAATELRGYRVRVVTKGGTSVWSNVAYYPHALSMHGTGTSTDLAAPSGVTPASNAAGELTLTWQGAQGAESFVLIVVRTDTFAHTSMSIADGAARTGTFTGLASGVEYIGIVVALQGTGADLKTPHGSSAAQTVQ